MLDTRTMNAQGKCPVTFHILDTRLGKYTGDTLVNALYSKIALLRIEDRIGTMNLHKETLRLLIEFAGESILFDMIAVQWLKKCESYWLRTGKNLTSIGMHMRNIRAIMNDARKSGVIKDSQYPFGKGRYEIQPGESAKKALTLDQIGQIYRLKTFVDRTFIKRTRINARDENLR